MMNIWTSMKKLMFSYKWIPFYEKPYWFAEVLILAERGDVRTGIYFRTVMRFSQLKFIPKMNEESTEESCVYSAHIDDIVS